MPTLGTAPCFVTGFEPHTICHCTGELKDEMSGSEQKTSPAEKQLLWLIWKWGISNTNWRDANFQKLAHGIVVDSVLKEY